MQAGSKAESYRCWIPGIIPILCSGLSINCFTGNVGCWYLASGDGALRIRGRMRMRWWMLDILLSKFLTWNINLWLQRTWVNTEWNRLMEPGLGSESRSENILSIPSQGQAVPAPCWLTEPPSLFSFQEKGFPLENTSLARTLSLTWSS